MNVIDYIIFRDRLYQMGITDIRSYIRVRLGIYDLAIAAIFAIVEIALTATGITFYPYVYILVPSLAVAPIIYVRSGIPVQNFLPRSVRRELGF